MMPGQPGHSQIAKRGRPRSMMWPSTAPRAARAGRGGEVGGADSWDEDDDEDGHLMEEFMGDRDYQELFIPVSALRSRNMITRGIDYRSESSGSSSGMSTEDSVMPPPPPKQDKSESFSPGFKQVTVELSGDPINSPVFINTTNMVRKDEKPWIRGNIYSWPVGTLFDHIDQLSKEWEDGGSSSEEEDDMQTGVDKGVKIPVTQIVAEMGIRKRATFPEIVTVCDSSDDEREINLNMQEIVSQAVTKYVVI